MIYIVEIPYRLPPTLYSLALSTSEVVLEDWASRKPDFPNLLEREFGYQFSRDRGQDHDSYQKAMRRFRTRSLEEKVEAAFPGTHSVWLFRSQEDLESWLANYQGHQEDRVRRLKVTESEPEPEPEPELKEYYIEWRIELDAVSPEAAVLEAQSVMRDTTMDWAFHVVPSAERDTSAMTLIDTEHLT